MDNILSSINEIYSEILRKKSLVVEQEKKLHFFGGASCKMGGGPDGHSSFNPKSWEVNRAWDIMGLEGTSVNSLDNGEVVSVNLKNYNPETKEYGYSIIVNTGMDKIYYTHLSSVGPKIKQGQRISQGDLIGKIGKPKEDPNWPSHVHVAIEKGNLNSLMDGYCNLFTKKTTDSTNSSSANTDDSKFLYGNKSFADLVLPSDIKNFGSPVNEAVMLAPVPIKPGFKGNFNQVRAKGYIHPGTDIPIPSGTPVKAPLSGKVVGVKANQHPCGGTIDIQYSDGFWSRFCHMKQINVKEGDVVNRGDVVGLSGGGSNDYGRGRSSGPHLHFTLKKDGRKVDPAHYMEKFNASDLTFDKSDLNQTSSSDSDEIEGEVDYSSAIKSINSNDNSSSSSSSSSTNTLYGNSDLANFMANALNIKLENEIKEEKVYDDFGKSPQSRYGSVTLPKDKNDKIKSPVKGMVSSGKYNPSCVNQISISHKVFKKDFTLEYCGISKPSVRKGDSISKGTVLGRTNDDVTISLFDESGSRVYIDNYIKAEIEKSKEETRRGNPTEPKFLYDNPWGQILGAILISPFKAFEDKYDQSGKMIQKRTSSPTEKNQVDDWLAQKSPTYSKKVNEQIKRIKKML